MSQVILSLGGVPFQNFEVPEKITFGGAQRVAVHRLIGGGRMVDALGYDDGEIVFSGVFAGADAALRAQALDAARALGAVIPLVWDSFFYNVILAEFAADYKKPWWIAFAVRCVVVNDPLSALADIAAPAVNLIANDIASADGFSGQAGISLGSLNAPNATSLAAAQTAVTAAMAAGGSALAGSVMSLNSAADDNTGVAAMSQMAASSAQLAALGGMSGYINRAAVNFAGELT